MHSVLFDEVSESWIVTGYPEGRFVLERDDLFSAAHPTGEPEEDALSPFLGEFFNQVLFLDGARHRRVRSELTAPLGAKAKTMRPDLQRIVGKLLQETENQTVIDVENDFAAPLTILGLARMFGVSDERVSVSRMREWSDAFLDLITGFFSTDAMERATEMHEYFRALLAEKRSLPREDLASAYALSPGLGERERTINAMVMFTAGNTTTTALLAGALPELLANASGAEGIVRSLRENPSGGDGLLQELLRVITPTQYLARFARREVSIGSARIRAGDKVLAHLARMNRDPNVFPDPHTFDPRRSNGHRHVAFGAGPHRCPGAWFALLTAGCALGPLLALHPRLLPGFACGGGHNKNQRRYRGVRIARGASR